MTFFLTFSCFDNNWHKSHKNYYLWIH